MAQETRHTGHGLLCRLAIDNHIVSDTLSLASLFFRKSTRTHQLAILGCDSNPRILRNPMTKPAKFDPHKQATMFISTMCVGVVMAYLFAYGPYIATNFGTLFPTPWSFLRWSVGKSATLLIVWAACILASWCVCRVGGLIARAVRSAGRNEGTP